MNTSFYFNPWVILCTVLAPISWVALWIIWFCTDKIRRKHIRIAVTALGAILLYYIFISSIMLMSSYGYEPPPYRDPFGAIDD